MNIAEQFKLTPVGYRAEDFIGQNYTTVKVNLENQGFTEFELVALNDLPLNMENEAGVVCRVLIDGNTTYDSQTEYPNDTKIVIEYHSIHLISPPLSSKEAKGNQYADVLQQFQNAGFINIQTEIQYDLIAGWFTKDGEIESITINGEKFKTENEYRPDAKVIITYHTFKKNSP